MTPYINHLSDISHFCIPCSDCDCPPSRTTWFAPPCRDFISGQILDFETHSPIAEVQIWIQGVQVDFYATAQSDSLGRFLAGPLPSNKDYIVNINSRGTGWSGFKAEVYLDDNLWLNQILLRRTGMIEGIVKDSDDNVVEGVTVCCSHSDQVDLHYEVETDEDGRFCICDMEISGEGEGAVTFSIAALHDDFSAFVNQIIVSEYRAGDSIIPINIVLNPRGYINGLVTEDNLPLSDVRVQIVGRTDGPLLGTALLYSDASGGFQMSLNAPAMYRVLIDDDRFLHQIIDVNVIPGQTTPLVVSAPTPGTIEGQIFDLQGLPVQSATVEAFNEQLSESQAMLLTEDGIRRAPYNSTSDASGMFQISAVPAGQNTYVVTVRAPSQEIFTGYHKVLGVSVESALPTALTLTVGINPPQISLLSVPSQPISTSFEFIYAVSGEIGVFFTTMSIDGDEVDRYYVSSLEDSEIVGQETINFVWQSDSYANGFYEFSVQCFDVSGNMTTEYFQVEVAH